MVHSYNSDSSKVMEFTNDESRTDLIVATPVISQNDLISGDLKVVNNLQQGSSIAHVYSNITASDSLKSSVEGSDVSVVPTSIPLYLFSSSSNVADGENIEVTSVPQEVVKEGPDGGSTLHSLDRCINLQIPYFDDAQGQSLISIAPVTTISSELNHASNMKVVNDTPTELSEEMIRSFVVGGSSLPKRISGSPQQNTDEALEKTKNSLPITAIISTGDIHPTDEEESIPEKQVIILTEDGGEIGDDGDGDDDMVAADRDSVDNDNVIMINGSEDNEILVTLINNKSDVGVGHRTDFMESNVFPMTTLPSAEEILQNQPVLDMNFEIVKEVMDLHGTIKSREITTQTKPIRGHSRKRKASMQKVVDVSNFCINIDNNEMEQNLALDSPESDAYKTHRCPRCGLKFINLDTLFIHTKCHTILDKEYKCYQCEFTAPHWVKMYHHLFTHGIEKPYKCSQCVFSCVNKSDLTAHMFVHSKTKDWICDKCNRYFKHRRNMVAHYRVCPGVDSSGNLKKNVSSPVFPCQVCNKQLSNKRNLEKHMEIHRDIKPFVCDLCGHSTRLKESLNMHKRLHTGEKPFKCDLCEYSTPDKSSLRRHKRRHTNEKPYCCPYCDYKSIQKHCLDTHVRRKHTGEQFVCGLCHFTTPDRYALNQHFKQHQTNIIDDLQQPNVFTNLQQSNTIVSLCNNVFRSLPKATILPTHAEGEENTTVEEESNIYSEKAAPVVKNSNKQDLEVGAQAVVNKAEEEQSLSRELHSENVAGTENRTIELGTQESLILQQIQEPGDFVFLQESGEIVIKKQDGRILIIQQEEESETPQKSLNSDIIL